jgi:hypothetical protein
VSAARMALALTPASVSAVPMVWASVRPPVSAARTALALMQASALAARMASASALAILHLAREPGLRAREPEIRVVAWAPPEQAAVGSQLWRSSVAVQLSWLLPVHLTTISCACA